MNKLLLLCLLVSVLAIAQNDKKRTLLDENGNEIGIQAFHEKQKDKKYYCEIFEKDGTTIMRLVLLEDSGIMSQDDKKVLLNELKKITGRDIDSTQTLVINFYITDDQPEGSCIDHYTSDESYKREMARKKNKTKQFFIVEKGYNYPKNKVTADSNGVVEKICFKKALACGNYIIIKPNNSYYIKMGEYRQDQILDKVKSRLVKAT